MKIEPFNPGAPSPQTSMPSFQKQGKIDVFNDENAIEATNPTPSPERTFKRGREEVKKVNEISSPVLRPCSSAAVPPTPMPFAPRKTNYTVPPTPMATRTKTISREKSRRVIGLKFPEETRMKTSAQAALFRSNESKRPRIDETIVYPKNVFVNRVERTPLPGISHPLNLTNISPMPITPSVFSSVSSSSQPHSFGKFDVTQKAANVAIRQVTNLVPFYEAFPDLLKDARFLKNGVENAVFQKGPDVFKIPIRNGSEMLPSRLAAKYHEEWKSNYKELIPTFAKLTSIRLTATEFHTIKSENAAALYYTKQSFYPTDVNINSLTSKMIEELRGLILQQTRADIRPSNFKMDENDLLQLIDYNMPEDEDLDIPEMCRVWNVIHPKLGALLVEENEEKFQQQLREVFPEKCSEDDVTLSKLELRDC